MSFEQFEVPLCTLRIRNENLVPLRAALEDAGVHVEWYSHRETFLWSFGLRLDAHDKAHLYEEDHIFNLTPMDAIYPADWRGFFGVAEEFLEDDGELLLEGNCGTRVGWMIRDGKAIELKGVLKWVLSSAPDEVSEALTQDPVGLTDPERAEDLSAREGRPAE